MMLQTIFFIDVSEIRRYPSIKPEFVSSSATIHEACRMSNSFVVWNFAGFRFNNMKSLHCWHFTRLFFLFCSTFSKKFTQNNWTLALGRSLARKKSKSSKPKSWNIMSIKQIDRKFCLKNTTAAEERGYVGKQLFQVLSPFQGHNFCGAQPLQVQFSYYHISSISCRNKKWSWNCPKSLLRRSFSLAKCHIRIPKNPFLRPFSLGITPMFLWPWDHQSLSL